MLTLFQSQLSPAAKSTAIDRQLVAVLGASLLMDGVETGLHDIPAFDVVHVPEELSDTAEYLNALAPDIILFDWDGPGCYHILSYMRQNPETLIFGLDLFSHKVTHLSGQLYSISSTNGLLWLIEQKSRERPAAPPASDQQIKFDDLVEGILLAYTQAN